MTERERRALGLPPTPQQVALAKSIQAMAKRQIAPAVAEITRIGSAVAEAMRPAMEMAIYVQESRQMVIPARRPYLEDPRLDALLEKLSERTSSTDAESIPAAPTKVAVVPLPLGAKWENVKVRFKDPHTLSVFYKEKHIDDYSYEKLGFARGNTRDKVPDKQWELLAIFSLASMHKTKFKPTLDMLASRLYESQQSISKAKSACQQVKGSLSEKLQDAFGIHDDPFYPYEKEAGYRLRFTLEPLPLLRGKGELHASGKELFDNIEDESFDNE